MSRVVVGIVGDSHANQARRWDEHCRVMSWIASDMRARGVTLAAHAGDVFDVRSTSVEREFVDDWTCEVADFAATVFATGNHDDSRDILALAHLRTTHPVRAFDRPGVVHLGGAVLGVLPWPRKAHLLASLDRAVAPEEAGRIAAELLRNVIGGLGDVMAARATAAAPRIFLSHAMIDGARTDHDQPLVGADMAISLADVGLARATFSAIGHVHAQQEWTWNEAPIAYTSAPYHCNFGEPGPKGYIIATFDGARLVGWERVATPCTPMLLAVDEWGLVDGLATVVDGWVHDWRALDPSAVAGAEIRMRYRVAADKRDAARRAAAIVRDGLLERGAVAVKVEEEVIPTLRARAPEIAAAPTLEAQLGALWSAKGIEVDEVRAERVFTLLRAQQNGEAA